MSSVFDLLGAVADRGGVDVADLTTREGVDGHVFYRGLLFELCVLPIMVRVRLRRWMTNHSGSYLPECGSTRKEVAVFLLERIAEAAEEQGVSIREISTESLIELLQEYIV